MATAKAVWIGIPKTTVRRAIVTPAPPIPMKPMAIPSRTIVKNSILSCPFVYNQMNKIINLVDIKSKVS